jgi:hypothetical protein
MTTVRRATALVALLAAVAGCGSTVQVRSSGQSGLSGDGPTASSGGLPTAAVTPGTGVGDLETPGGTSTPDSVIPGAPATPGSESPGAGGGGPAAVTGPITLGFLLPSADQSETAAQFGASNNNTVGPRGMTMALVAYLNKHGGIAGRPIHPVYAQISATGGSYDAQFQSACEAFVKDNKVSAVLSQIAYSPVLASCLRSAGVPILLGQFSTTDASGFAKGMLYASYGLSDDVRYRLVLEQHAASGFLSPKSRIGVLRGGCANDIAAYERTVVPTLKQLGLKPVTEVTVRCVSGFADTGGAVTDLQAAVLRFASNGVDRIVLVSNDEANGVYLFSLQAENQGYRPGYAVSSNFAASVARPNMPATQARNVRGIGWIPELDDEQAHQRTAVESRCLSALGAEGQHAVTATDRYFAYSVCGAMFLYSDALSSSRGRDDAASIGRAISNMGSAIRLPGVLDAASRFTLRRPFGPARARPFAFAAACGCFRYLDSAVTIP